MVGSRDAGPPSRILFVEEMTGLIAESLPEFWKLGQAYISGSLFQGMHMTDERQQLQQQSCEKNKDTFEVHFERLHIVCVMLLSMDGFNRIKC